MRSSILIALLIVAISSLTSGGDDGNNVRKEIPKIFGVEMNPKRFWTLDADQVKKEIATKEELEQEIDNLPTTINKNGWCSAFKSMIKSEKKIMEKLQVELSNLHTLCFGNINKKEFQEKFVKLEKYEILQRELRTYLGMLDGYDLTNYVETERPFFGNQFADFLAKVVALKETPDELNVNGLKISFQKAAKKIGIAKDAIFKAITKISARLRPQKNQSSEIMAAIQKLNVLAASPFNEHVERSVEKLEQKLIALNQMVKDINIKAPKLFILDDARSWNDRIARELSNIDNAHNELIKELGKLGDLKIKKSNEKDNSLTPSSSMSKQE